MSRPRPSAVGQFGVTIWSFEVTTWGKLPERVATSTRPTSARPALAVRATCAQLACCTRSSAHDLGTARAVCTRDLGSGVRTVHPTQFCDKTLFTGKKKYKNFKNFLVYDLKYKIIILKLL